MSTVLIVYLVSFLLVAVIAFNFFLTYRKKVTTRGEAGEVFWQTVIALVIGLIPYVNIAWAFLLLCCELYERAQLVFPNLKDEK